MLKSMKDTGPRLTQESVGKFEDRLGFTLPEDYKEFLLCYNGGTPFPHHYEVNGWSESYTGINEFNGIIPGQYNDIEENVELLKGRLPLGFIPIADDPGGNTLLLSVAGDTRGAIYFWDHENEPYERGTRLEDYPNIYWVADSFSDFLKNLKEYS